MNKQTYREIRTILDRIYRLETQLKTLDYEQHNESTAKIDYVAMMADIELETEEEPIEDLVEGASAEDDDENVEEEA